MLNLETIIEFIQYIAKPPSSMDQCARCSGYEVVLTGDSFRLVRMVTAQPIIENIEKNAAGRFARR